MLEIKILRSLAGKQGRLRDALGGEIGASLPLGEKDAFHFSIGGYSADPDRVFVDLSYARSFGLSDKTRLELRAGPGWLWPVGSSQPAGRNAGDAFTAHLAVSLERDLSRRAYLVTTPRLRWLDIDGGETLVDVGVGLGFRF